MVEPGQPLGSRYRLTAPLGSGAMGEVWRGVDDEGTELAIKLLKPAYAEDADVVRRFVAERSLLMGVQHPNVVRVRDLVIEGSTLAIVMDLVNGGDLRHLTREHQTLQPGDVAAIGAQVAAGLAAIHERRIVHRDIKPENVLLEFEAGQPSVRITDFGVARLSEEGSAGRQSTMIAGTPHYMAPELFEGELPRPAADLYSLGILLYELSCGLPPFWGRATAAVMYAHAHLRPGRPPGVPDPLWDVIQGLLAKRVDERPTSAAAVSERLAGVYDLVQGAPAAERLREAPFPVPIIDTPRPSPVGTAGAPPSLPGRDLYRSDAAAGPGDARPSSDPGWRGTVAPPPPGRPHGAGASQYGGQPSAGQYAGQQDGGRQYAGRQDAGRHQGAQQYGRQPFGDRPDRGQPPQGPVDRPHQATAAQPGGPRPSRGWGLPVVLAVLLVLAVAGGVWVMRERGQEVTTSPSRTVSVPPQPSPSGRGSTPAASTADPTSPDPTTPAPPPTSPSASTPGPTISSPSERAAFPAGVRACSDAVGVNSTTSCGFAQNVFVAYRASSRQGTVRVTATSPVTKKSYEMTCESGPLTTCRGGNDAVVYIR